MKKAILLFFVALALTVNARATDIGLIPLVSYGAVRAWEESQLIER